MRLRLSTAPHILAKDNTRIIMQDVLIALAPTTAAGIYFFGWQAALLLAVSILSAVVAEGVWQLAARRPVRIGDLSAAVTGMLVALNLPSTAPWWVAVVGSVFAVIVVKQLFGGIGHNFMNPALAARALLLLSWPVRMTTYLPPQRLIDFTGASTAEVGDVITSATPLSTGSASIYDLFMGNITGTIGEVCKAAILIGFVYLLIRGTIGFHIPVLFVGSVALMTWVLGGDPLYAVLSGGVLFGAVFMATDYVTNPMLLLGQCIFAVGCGVMVVIIREFTQNPEGVTYAILLMNAVTPLIDRFMKRKVYGEVKTHA